MNHPISRRDFAKAAALLGVGALTPLPLAATAESLVAAKVTPPRPARYRAVSWWLTWDDLTWPNPELRDKIRRRVDQCVASGVNCCLIFGAHFRWDFMPIWGRLHDELRFIADELHQRQILFFDHHSSVLTHRPRNRDEAQNIWQKNRHHVPFYPSNEEAATWRFAGSHLNDWRMLDVETGAPIYLPAYNAEQFCMNHPAFRAAYVQYVRRLRAETGIDGLMSDDNIFYADWRACACTHCRERFKRECGRELPPVSDTSFWGNRSSEAFKDWIAMRFRSSADFLADVKAALPGGFPLLTCCSSSDGAQLPAYGMSYEDFIAHCNHVLLEMVGSTPTPAGTWDDRIPSQLLHVSIAAAHRAPCFGQGYGFFPDTAFFIWAVNKFLGSDSWFSTLKGRLNASPAELTTLDDDPQLVGEGYCWERDHPELFQGAVDTDVSVFFSRATRDYLGQVAGDYSADYATSCLSLTRAGITCDVATRIPEFGVTRTLVLGSASCLAAGQRRQLHDFLRAGGTVIATGPVGFHDERGHRLGRSWLGGQGVDVRLNEPPRPGNFPPDSNLKPPVALAQCEVPEAVRQRMQGEWLRLEVGKGELFWRPERISSRGVADAVIQLARSRNRRGLQFSDWPERWRARQFRDGDRVLIHALPAQVETVLHATLTNQMGGQRVVERLIFTKLAGELTIRAGTALKGVKLHSPDLPAAREARRDEGGAWAVSLADVRRYFVLECRA